MKMVTIEITIKLRISLGEWQSSILFLDVRPYHPQYSRISRKNTPMPFIATGLKIETELKIQAS